MNRRGQKGDTDTFRTWITLMFLFLTVTLEGLMAVYWTAVLEPQLMSKAEVTARALAQSHVYAIADAMTEDAAVGEIIRNMENAINRILLLTDPDTTTPFILGVEVEADYSVVNAPEAELDMKRGQIGQAHDFLTEIPLYSKLTRELLGIVRLHNSPEFFRHFKADVRFTFFVGAGVGLALLILSWRIVAALSSKVKQTERKLREKQAQIVHAGRLTAMGEMATGIAHEINQPLAIIRIAADGLNSYFARQGIKGMEAKAAWKIVEQVNRAASIINNMRAFARADSEISDQVNLAEPVNRALSFFKEQFRIHDIVLTVSLAENLPKVRMNPQKFEQIVVNFLSNARYAVEKKGENAGSEYQKTVRVDLFHDTETDAVVFEVEDNGAGMSAEVRERCMEPFYTTKGVGEGTGLGLSIVHGITREFKMDISVDSVEGEGSTFRIRDMKKSGGFVNPASKKSKKNRSSVRIDKSESCAGAGICQSPRAKKQKLGSN
ncbi:ATP-binding protein [Desulfococcaceae bacterium HSG8]|nr:ATP-binding protein [Desulfococcaceae bacterium HSG8]